MPPAGFQPGMVVMDTVYHPENTMFLKLARERECQTVSGRRHVHPPGGASSSSSTPGKEAPVDLMREVVRRKLGPIRG